MASAIQAVQHHSEGKTFAIVRCHKGDDATLTTALDAGAAGIVIPHCEAAEEVIEMHEKIYYRKSSIFFQTLTAHTQTE